MAQPVTRGKQHSLSSIVYDTGAWFFFQPIPALGAAVTGTTIQDYYPMVTGGKILLFAATFSAIGTPQANHVFNVVVGTLAAYETGASTASTQTATVAGAGGGVQGETYTTTIAGVTFVATAPSNPNVSKIAAAIVAAALDTTTPIPVNAVNNAAGISGLPFDRVFSANNNAGVVTFGALYGGASMNTIPVVCSTNSATETYTAGGATLAGGVSATGISIPANDTIISTGVATNPTPGMALFSNDQALVGAPAGSVALRYATHYMPDNWDALLPPGSVLTLRVQTPASTGSIANLRIGFFAKPYEGKITSPSKVAVPNAGFLPLRDCG